MILTVLAIATVGYTVYYVDSIASDDTSVTRLYTAENMGTTNAWNVNFMPVECQLSDFSYHQPSADEGLEYGNYVKKGTTVTVDLVNTTEQTRYFEIPLTGYKGYAIKATGSDAEQPYITQDRGAHGDLRIAVPPNYSGTITVSYQDLALFLK
jgi:hypothetical protein